MVVKEEDAVVEHMGGSKVELSLTPKETYEIVK